MTVKNIVNKYGYLVEYDSEDNIYVAKCVEMPSIMAHGKTNEEALKEVKKVVEFALKWMQEEGEEIILPNEDFDSMRKRINNPKRVNKNAKKAAKLNKKYL